MRFKTARFSHFRNIEYCELNLDQRDHFMFGVNGQGKSNCLEGICFISALRSFRTQMTKPLFKKGYQEFVLLYELEHENLGHTEVEIKLSGNQKLLFIDGDHSYKGVMDDFKNYFEFVNEGGIIVFDNYNDKNPEYGIFFQNISYRIF